MNSDDSPRLLELRRRVQADPASIAFAQLAEEYRRAGANEEAVAVARAGLQHHPACISARVTLGRALVELERLTEAEQELLTVVQAAPGNLAACRALAEVYQKRGQLPEALAQYRKALELARFDPGHEEQASRIEDVATPAPPAAKPATAPVEDLFDFDTLIAKLGCSADAPAKLGTPVVTPPVFAAPSIVDSIELAESDTDPFSLLERQLRESAPSPEELAERRTLGDLEEWLSAIAVDRDDRPSA